MISLERRREILKELGVPEVSPDDPIYREPPSIFFVNGPRTPATDSPPKSEADPAENEEHRGES
jgi:hypothetical protein